MADHIHTPDDGRGARYVYLNGRLIERAFCVDTKRGIVDAYVVSELGSIKIHKRGKRPLSKRYRGKVEVVPCD